VSIPFTHESNAGTKDGIGVFPEQEAQMFTIDRVFSAEDDFTDWKGVILKSCFPYFE
jgi:hypothetical protein